MLHLENQQFGLLRVIERSTQKDSQGRCYLWRCHCVCGKEVLVSGTQLRQKVVQSCGCLQAKSRFKDITGHIYGRLKAIAPTGEICNHSSVWRCECSCGNIIETTMKSLLWGRKRSCGCLARETKARQALAMQAKCGRVDGTNISRIRSKKVPVNNSTGVKGVSWHRAEKRYVARIGFKGQKYHLGYGDTIDQAAALRKQAEDTLYAPYIDE